MLYAHVILTQQYSYNRKLKDKKSIASYECSSIGSYQQEFTLGISDIP